MERVYREREGECFEIEGVCREIETGTGIPVDLWPEL